MSAYDYARPVVGDSEWMLLADWWTRYDARGAYQWVLSQRDHKTPGVLRYVIAGMARQDPKLALATLATLREKVHRDAAFAAIVRSWFHSDPDGLLQHLIEMRPGPERQRSISTLAALKVRREGIDATRSWAESLDDDLPQRFKLQVYRRVATELAYADPAAARAWAERHGPGPLGSGLARRISVVTALDDPEGTLAWLSGLPAGPDRDQAVEEVYRRWLKQDEEAATAWMVDAPREPWMERAFEAFVISRFAEPDEALALARQIPDPERRHSVESRIAVAWFGRDASAAGAWLETSDLPPDLKRKVRDRAAQAEQRRLKMAERRRNRDLRKQERAALEQ